VIISDLRQSKEYARYLQQAGWRVEKTNGVFVFIRPIPLTPFSIIKIQRPTRLPDLKKTESLAKKYRSLLIFIEPKKAIDRQLAIIRNQGYRLCRSHFLPTKTIHLDLTQSEKELLAQMKKDTRYSIRKTTPQHISIYVVKQRKDLKALHSAWRKSAGWRLIIPSFKNILALKNSFGQNAIFLTAALTTPAPPVSDLPVNRKQAIIAGAIILIADKTAYYYYAFTSQKGRKFLAQYRLVWEAINRTKKLGCKVFDFEGIYDPRFPIKSWLGFSHFKKSFGGKEVNYPGCFKKGGP
jgi:lipid II:glycine glycyltransferase (peptidoglycan interpeptide bridge formation enzyme)